MRRRKKEKKNGVLLILVSILHVTEPGKKDGRVFTNTALQNYEKKKIHLFNLQEEQRKSIIINTCLNERQFDLKQENS